MTLVAPFADIEAMLASTTMDMLANAIATPSGGVEFLAMLDVDNTEFFDGAKGVDYVLRYVAPNALDRGDAVTITGSRLVADGTVLRVSAKPRVMHSGCEFVAPVARVL
jgi:hypothetical protein